jgi:hypothetical protein
LQQRHDVLVQRVHVLHEPLCGRVVDLAGVVNNRKVSDATEIRFHEFRMDVVGRRKLLDECLVGGLREPTFLIQERHDTARLVDEVNCGLQIESKVNELPFDPFALIFLLFENEHRVIEELLQLLVGVIDAKLLEAVELEDFKTGHIEDPDEAGALTLGAVERAVDAVYEPLEHSFVAGLCDGFDGEFDLLFGLSLCHEIAANLDAWRQEGFRHVGDAQAQQMSNLLSDCVVGQCRLVRAAFLLESHRAEQQNGADDAEDRVEVVLCHSHDVHALDSRLVFSGIIDSWHGQQTIREERIAADVVEDEAFALVSGGTGEQLIEDMECALILSLADSPRLLQQVSFDVGTGNVPGSVEVDANEFTLKMKMKID